MRTLPAFLAVAVVAGLAAAPTATATRATVQKNGDVGCRTDPGDIPGTGAIALPMATAVFRPDGSFLLQCHGSLPAGVSFSSAFRTRVACNGVPGAARILVTPSGRINAFCIVRA